MLRHPQQYTADGRGGTHDTACEGLDIEMPAINLHTLNSQAAEHFNAKLNQISTQCAYMKQSNFMAFVKYYLYRCNANIWKCWVKKYSVPVS